MIIIEGTDLVGKTTLCHKLVERLVDKGWPYRYSHLSRLPDSWNAYWDYLSKFDACAVQDRFHDSELAYSYARNDENSKKYPRKLCDHTYRLLNAYLVSKSVMKVCITSDVDYLSSRYKEKGDDMYDEDVIQKANAWFSNNRNRFDYVFNVSFKCPFVHEGWIDNVVAKYSQRREHLCKVLARRPYYV